jgi:hypothetical protein
VQLDVVPALSSDGGWEDVQHVSFSQGSALKIAQGDTVQQNERIVLYFPIQMNPGSLEVLSESRTESLFELG